VVDGGSTDGTVDLLRQYSNVLAHWISERDRGIYDAWNKACGIASGQWLIFVGAGDELASPTMLEQMSPILRAARPAHDLVYGRLELISERERNTIEHIDRPWNKIERRWQFFRPCLPMHPETFHHRSLFVGEQPFDLRFRYGADAHFMLRALQRRPPLYVPVLIDRMVFGGVSTQPGNLWRIVREAWAMNADLGLKPPLAHTVFESLKLAVKLPLGLLPPTAFRLSMDCLRALLGKRRRWSIR
jgi:glycosyltransferase involved in cell wall biosynthesis